MSTVSVIHPVKTTSIAQRRNFSTSLRLLVEAISNPSNGDTKLFFGTNTMHNVNLSPKKHARKYIVGSKKCRNLPAEPESFVKRRHGASGNPSGRCRQRQDQQRIISNLGGGYSNFVSARRIPERSGFHHGRVRQLLRPSLQSHQERDFTSLTYQSPANLIQRRWFNASSFYLSDSLNPSDSKATTASSPTDSTTRSTAASSSVSPSEISHFSRLASSWWDPHGPSRLLHLMNPLRHDFIKSCLSSTTPPPDTKYSYLDIGCGGGIFASSAARLPSTASVLAIDPTPDCITVAQQHQRSDPVLQPPKLTYLNCAIEDLFPTPTSPQASPEAAPSIIPPEGFDTITLFEVLEHVPHPSPFLSRCTTHLKPGGWLIGSTIARHPLSYLTTKLIAEAPLLGVVPRGTHDWSRYINPSELAGWFASQKQNEADSGKAIWAEMRTQAVVYLPGLGWQVAQGWEAYGNYFFGVQKLV